MSCAPVYELALVTHIPASTLPLLCTVFRGQVAAGLQ